MLFTLGLHEAARRVLADAHAIDHDAAIALAERTVQQALEYVPFLDRGRQSFEARALAKPLARLRLTPDARRLRLACRYGVGAIALAAVAIAAGGGWLWLLWPATSLALVALAYAAIGAAAFQKHGASHSFAATWLFAPYTIGAWINSRLWTRRRPEPDLIADSVWIGRMPGARASGEYPFAALVDVCAELPAPQRSGRHHGLPWLDLVVPSAGELRAAARAIESARRDGDVLVCCAAGYGRSACAVAAWLIATRRARDADDALAIVRARRPGVALGVLERDALQASWAPSLETASSD
jgi:dual specificity protein phosphatase-like protein